MECAFSSGVKKCNDQQQGYSTLEAAGQVQIEGIVIKSSTSSLTKQIVPLPQNQGIVYPQTLQQQTFQNGCPPCPPCPPCSHLPISGQYGHENPYGFISRNGNSRDSEYPATFFGGRQMTMPHNVTAPQYNYSANITTVPTMTQVYQSQFQNPNAEQMNPLIFSRAPCNGMQGAGNVNQSPVPTHLNIQPSTIYSRPAGAQHCSAVPGGSPNQNLTGSPTAQGGQLTYQGVNTLLAQDLERQQFIRQANFSNMGALNMQGPPNCGGMAVGANNNYYSPVQQVQNLNQQQSNLNTIKYSPLGMTPQLQQTQVAPEQYDFNIHAMRNYEAAAQSYGVQSSSPSQIYLQEISQNNRNNFPASIYPHQIQNPNGLQQEHQNPYFGPLSAGLPAGSSQPGVWNSNSQVNNNSNSMATNQNFNINIPPDAAQTYNIMDLQNELDRRQRQGTRKPISKTNLGQDSIKSTSTSTLSKTCKKNHTLNSKQSTTSTGITWKDSKCQMRKKPVSPKQTSTNTNGSQTSGTRVTGITWKTSESQISKRPTPQKDISTNEAQTSCERSTGITWKTSKSHVSKHPISRKQPSTTGAQTSCERIKTCPGLRIRKRSYLPRPCTCCSCCQPCCCPPEHIVSCDPCKRNKPDTISCPCASCKRCSCTLSCSSIPEAAQPYLPVPALPATATALTPEDRAKFEVCRKEMLLEQELQSQRNAMMMQQELQNQRQALLLQKEMQNQRQIFVLQQELQNRRQAMIVQKQICESPQRKIPGMQYTTRPSSCKRKYVSPRTKSPSPRMDCNGNHVISYTNLAREPTSTRKRACSPAGGQIGGNRYLGLQEKLSDIISTFPIGYQVNSINNRHSGGYQQHSLESRHTGSSGANSIDNRSTGSCKPNLIGTIGSIPTGSYQANSTETRTSGNNKLDSVDSIPTGSYKSNSTESKPAGNYKPNSAESRSTRTKSYQPSAGSRPAESFKSNHSESRRTESHQPQPHSIESRSIGLQAEASITTSAFQTDYQQEGIQIRQTRSYRLDFLEYQNVNSTKPNSKDTRPTGRYQPNSIEGSYNRSYQPNSIDSRPTGNYGQNSIESRPAENYRQNSIESGPPENYRQNSIESRPTENYRQNSIESRPTENGGQNSIQSRSKENSQSSSGESRSTENSQPNSNGSGPKKDCQPNSLDSRPVENCQPNSLESRPVGNYQPNSIGRKPQESSKPYSFQNTPTGSYQPNYIGSNPQESSKPYSFQNTPIGSYQPNSIGSNPQESSKPYSFQSRPNVSYTPNSIETKPEESYKPYSFQNIPTGSNQPNSTETRPAGSNPPIPSGSRPTSKRPTYNERRTMRSYSHVNENTQTQGMTLRTHQRSPMLRTGRLGKTWVHKKKKSKEKRRQLESLECGSATVNGPSPGMCPNSNTYGQVQDNSFVQDCGCGCGHCRDCNIQNISKLVKYPEAQNL